MRGRLDGGDKRKKGDMGVEKEIEKEEGGKMENLCCSVHESLTEAATNFLCNDVMAPFVVVLILALVVVGLKLHARGVQYSGRVIARRVQYGLQIKFGITRVEFCFFSA